MFNPMMFMQQIQNLKKAYPDPNKQIQDMIRSGQITQAQYDQVVQQVEQLRKMFS